MSCRILALFLCVSLVLSDRVAYSAQSAEAAGSRWKAVDKDFSAAPIDIPSELGTIDEVYENKGENLDFRSWVLDENQRSLSNLQDPTSNNQNPQSTIRHPKTIIYIQDAHDSLEAQENIARIIAYLVGRKGVRTVFEEGYEGPVPTDKYFGRIGNPATKEKVSYFLMDKLRLGGAEYAHINRLKNFKLIGADSQEMYLKNIEWYRHTAKNKAQAERERSLLDKQIRKLAQKFFPRDLKEWLKLKDLQSRGRLGLADYLERMTGLYGKFGSFRTLETQYPAVALIASHKSRSSEEGAEALQSLDPKQLFREMSRLEEEYAGIVLEVKSRRKRVERNGEKKVSGFGFQVPEKTISNIQFPISNTHVLSSDTRHPSSDTCFRILAFLRGLDLLRRLNALEVTPPEYEASRNMLRVLRTKNLARFIAAESKKSVIFSRRWEANIRSAMKFYETARGREWAIRETLRQWGENSGEEIAILVYGGFHRKGIEEILRQTGNAYVVVQPRMTSVSQRHQGYYRRLMTNGRHEFEMPFNLRIAARALSELQLGRLNGEEAIQSELDAIAVVVDSKPLDRELLSRTVEELLRRPVNNARGEAQAPVVELPQRSIPEHRSPWRRQRVSARKAVLSFAAAGFSGAGYAAAGWAMRNRARGDVRLNTQSSSERVRGEMRAEASPLFVSVEIPEEAILLREPGVGMVVDVHRLKFSTDVDSREQQIRKLAKILRVFYDQNYPFSFADDPFKATEIDDWDTFIRFGRGLHSFTDFHLFLDESGCLQGVSMGSILPDGRMIKGMRQRLEHNGAGAELLTNAYLKLAYERGNPSVEIRPFETYVPFYDRYFGMDGSGQSADEALIRHRTIGDTAVAFRVSHKKGKDRDSFIVSFPERSASSHPMLSFRRVPLPPPAAGVVPEAERVEMRQDEEGSVNLGDLRRAIETDILLIRQLTDSRPWKFLRVTRAIGDEIGGIITNIPGYLEQQLAERKKPRSVQKLKDAAGRYILCLKALKGLNEGSLQRTSPRPNIRRENECMTWYKFVDEGKIYRVQVLGRKKQTTRDARFVVNIKTENWEEVDSFRVDLHRRKIEFDMFDSMRTLMHRDNFHRQLETLSLSQFPWFVATVLGNIERRYQAGRQRKSELLKLQNAGLGSAVNDALIQNGASAAGLSDSAGSFRGRIGLAGLGAQGKRWWDTVNTMRARQQSGLTITAVDPRKVNLSAPDAGAKILRGDADLLIHDPEVSAIVIASWADTHLETARKALEAGKHVLVEKPLTLKAEEAQKLVRRARKKNLVLMPGHNLLYMPLFRKMQERIRSGQLGKILSMEAKIFNPSRPGLDTSSDALQDLGYHLLYMADALADNRAPPQIVSASRDNGGESYDAYLNYSGVPFHLEVNRNYSGHQSVRSLMVTGEKGALALDFSGPAKLTANPAEILNPNGFLVQSSDETERPLYRELQAFLNAITKQDAASVDPDSAVRVIETIEQLKTEGRFSETDSGQERSEEQSSTQAAGKPSEVRTVPDAAARPKRPELRSAEERMAVLFSSPSTITSHFPGTVQDFIDRYPAALAVYQEALKVINRHNAVRGASRPPLVLGDLYLKNDYKMQHGDTLLLCLASFLYGVALYRALEQELGRDFQPAYLTGNSTGALTALVISNAISLEDMLKYILETTDELVRQQNSHRYGYLRVTNVRYEEIEDFLAQNKDTAAVVNVVSGIALSIAVMFRDGETPKKFKKRLQALKTDLETGLSPAGAKIQSFYPPAYKGPHHKFFLSSMPLIREIVGRLKIRSPKIEVVSPSRRGKIMRTAGDVRKELVRGYFEPIWWSDTIHTLQNQGIQTYLEMGPGTALADWNRVLAPQSPTYNLKSPAAMAFIRTLLEYTQIGGESSGPEPEIPTKAVTGDGYVEFQGSSILSPQLQSRVRISAGEKGRGIIFRLVKNLDADRSDFESIEISPNSVMHTKGGIALSNGRSVYFIPEHILSALYGLEMDDVLVEAQGIAAPLAGSGSEIYTANLIGQPWIEKTRRDPFPVTQPFVVYSGGIPKFIVLPGEGLRVSFLMAFKETYPKRQWKTLTVTPQTYRDLIAPARTFTSQEGLAGLDQSFQGIQNYLTRSLEGPVLFQGDRLLTPERLRSDEDYLLHKVLDLLGDLRLAGRRISGHVIALGTGHGEDMDLVRTIDAVLAGGTYPTLTAERLAALPEQLQTNYFPNGQFPKEIQDALQQLTVRAETRTEVPFIDLKNVSPQAASDVAAATQKVHASGQYVGGPEGAKLEKEIARRCGVPYAVGVGSGTDALLLILKALGVGPGDEVITTPFTFFATAEVIALLGAKPVFVDIDPTTYCLDPELFRKAITKKTKAVVPVHLYGQMAGMKPILKIAKEQSIKVVADMAQSLGAESYGRPAGSFGNAAAISFYPTKNFGAAGDAGMIVTRSRRLAARIRMLANHGSRKRYHHEMIGYNSRLDEIQAAVLNAKIPYFDEWTKRREEIAGLYNQLLQGIPQVTLPTVSEGNRHVYHQYTIRVPRHLRGRLQKFLADNKIGTGIHYPKPLHLMPAFKDLGYSRGDFPQSEKAAREVLCLPVYPGLRDQQVRYVAGKIREFFTPFPKGRERAEMREGTSLREIDDQSDVITFYQGLLPEDTVSLSQPIQLNAGSELFDLMDLETTSVPGPVKELLVNNLLNEVIAELLRNSNRQADVDSIRDFIEPSWEISYFPSQTGFYVLRFTINQPRSLDELGWQHLVRTQEDMYQTGLGFRFLTEMEMGEGFTPKHRKRERHYWNRGSGLKDFGNLSYDRLLRYTRMLRKPYPVKAELFIKVPGSVVAVKHHFGDFKVRIGEKDHPADQQHIAAGHDTPVGFYFNVYPQPYSPEHKKWLCARFYYEKNLNQFAFDIPLSVYDDSISGGFRVGGVLPKDIRGRVTFQYSVDGGGTWHWANHGSDENYLIERSEMRNDFAGGPEDYGAAPEDEGGPVAVTAADDLDPAAQFAASAPGLVRRAAGSTHGGGPADFAGAPRDYSPLQSDELADLPALEYSDEDPESFREALRTHPLVTRVRHELARTTEADFMPRRDLFYLLFDHLFIKLIRKTAPHHIINFSSSFFWVDGKTVGVFNMTPKFSSEKYKAIVRLNVSFEIEKDFRGHKLPLFLLEILRAVTPEGHVMLLRSKLWHIPTLIKLIGLWPDAKIPQAIRDGLERYSQVAGRRDFRDGIRAQTSDPLAENIRRTFIEFLVQIMTDEQSRQESAEIYSPEKLKASGIFRYVAAHFSGDISLSVEDGELYETVKLDRRNEMRTTGTTRLPGLRPRTEMRPDRPFQLSPRGDNWTQVPETAAGIPNSSREFAPRGANWNTVPKRSEIRSLEKEIAAVDLKMTSRARSVGLSRHNRRVFLSVVPDVRGPADDQIQSALKNFETLLKEQKIKPEDVFKMVISFGDITDKDRGKIKEAFRRFCRGRAPPVITAVEQSPADGSMFSAEIYAAAGRDTEVIRVNENIAVVEDRDNILFYTGGVTPDAGLDDGYSQSMSVMKKTRACIAEAEALLKRLGKIPADYVLDYRRLFRIWFYQNDILKSEADGGERYSKLNYARHIFFTRSFNGMTTPLDPDFDGSTIPFGEGLIDGAEADNPDWPASTGIGMLRGTMVMESLGVIPKNREVHAYPVDSKRQMRPQDYPQSDLKPFSEKKDVWKAPPLWRRGMTLVVPLGFTFLGFFLYFLFGWIFGYEPREAYEMISVSGTASTRGSKVMFVGDPLRQALYTISSIHLVLKERGAKIEDIPQLRVYIKNPKHYQTMKYVVEKKFPGVPVIYVFSDVCRTDWLIEIEAFAFIKKKRSSLLPAEPTEAAGKLSLTRRQLFEKPAAAVNDLSPEERTALLALIPKALLESRNIRENQIHWETDSSRLDPQKTKDKPVLYVKKGDGTIHLRLYRGGRTAEQASAEGKVLAEIPVRAEDDTLWIDHGFLKAFPAARLFFGKFAKKTFAYWFRRIFVPFAQAYGFKRILIRRLNTPEQDLVRMGFKRFADEDDVWIYDAFNTARNEMRKVLMYRFQDGSLDSTDGVTTDGVRHQKGGQSESELSRLEQREIVEGPLLIPEDDWELLELRLNQWAFNHPLEYFELPEIRSTQVLRLESNGGPDTVPDEDETFGAAVVRRLRDELSNWYLGESEEIQPPFQIYLFRDEEGKFGVEIRKKGYAALHIPEPEEDLTPEAEENLFFDLLAELSGIPGFFEPGNIPGFGLNSDFTPDRERLHQQIQKEGLRVLKKWISGTLAYRYETGVLDRIDPEQRGRLNRYAEALGLFETARSIHVSLDFLQSGELAAKEDEDAFFDLLGDLSKVPGFFQSDNIPAFGLNEDLTPNRELFDAQVSKETFWKLKRWMIETLLHRHETGVMNSMNPQQKDQLWLRIQSLNLAELAYSLGMNLSPLEVEVERFGPRLQVAEDHVVADLFSLLQALNEIPNFFDEGEREHFGFDADGQPDREGLSAVIGEYGFEEIKNHIVILMGVYFIARKFDKVDDALRGRLAKLVEDLGMRAETEEGPGDSWRRFLEFLNFGRAPRESGASGPGYKITTSVTGYEELAEKINAWSRQYRIWGVRLPDGQELNAMTIYQELKDRVTAVGRGAGPIADSLGAMVVSQLRPEDLPVEPSLEQSEEISESSFCLALDLAHGNGLLEIIETDSDTVSFPGLRNEMRTIRRGLDLAGKNYAGREVVPRLTEILRDKVSALLQMPKKHIMVEWQSPSRRQWGYALRIKLRDQEIAHVRYRMKSDYRLLGARAGASDYPVIISHDSSQYPRQGIMTALYAAIIMRHQVTVLEIHDGLAGTSGFLKRLEEKGYVRYIRPQEDFNDVVFDVDSEQFSKFLFAEESGGKIGRGNITDTDVTDGPDGADGVRHQKGGQSESAKRAVATLIRALEDEDLIPILSSLVWKYVDPMDRLIDAIASGISPDTTPRPVIVRSEMREKARHLPNEKAVDPRDGIFKRSEIRLTDPRIVGGAERLDYLMRLRRKIMTWTEKYFPSRKGLKTVGLYVGSGADISTAFIATNAKRIIFVNHLPFYEHFPIWTQILFKFGAGAAYRKTAIENYISSKLQKGWAGTGSMSVTLGGVLPFLLAELELMKASDVKEPQEIEPGVFKLEFVWAGHPRELIYIEKKDMREPQSYFDLAKKYGHKKKVHFSIMKAVEDGAFLPGIFGENLNDLILEELLIGNGMMVLDKAANLPLIGLRERGAYKSLLEGTDLLGAEGNPNFGYGEDGAYVIQKRAKRRPRSSKTHIRSKMPSPRLEARTPRPTPDPVGQEWSPSVRRALNSRVLVSWPRTEARREVHQTERLSGTILQDRAEMRPRQTFEESSEAGQTPALPQTAVEMFYRLVPHAQADHGGRYAAEIMDSLEVTPQSCALQVGAGGHSEHAFFYAFRGGSFQLLQPDIDPISADREVLQRQEFQSDLNRWVGLTEAALPGEGSVIKARIDPETFRGSIQDLTLPAGRYSHLFLLNVFDQYDQTDNLKPYRQRNITKLLESLRDESTVLISAYVNPEWEIRFFTAAAGQAGYEVVPNGQFQADQTVYALKLKRNKMPAAHFSVSASAENTSGIGEMESALSVIGTRGNWHTGFDLPEAPPLQAGQVLEATSRAIGPEVLPQTVGSREVVKSLGAGLASEVYLVREAATGKTFVEKYFGRFGKTHPAIGRAVMGIFYGLFRGAPFAYRYNPYAVIASHYTNRLINELYGIEHPGKRLTPEILYTRFDEATQSYVQAFPYVEGRKVRLDELGQAKKALETSYQFLEKTGFWGLARQSDWRNLNAVGNLLKTGDGWVLIDIIPGVLGGFFWFLPLEISYFWRGLKTAQPFPFADAIDFTRLQSHVEQLRTDGQIDDTRCRALKNDIQTLQTAVARWRQSERKNRGLYRRWLISNIPRRILKLSGLILYAFWVRLLGLSRTALAKTRLAFRLLLNPSFRAITANRWIRDSLRKARAEQMISEEEAQAIQDEIRGRRFQITNLPFILYLVYGLIKSAGMALNAIFGVMFLMTFNPYYLVFAYFAEGLLRVPATLAVTWRRPAFLAAAFAALPTVGSVLGPVAQIYRDYPLLSDFILEHYFWTIGAACPGIDVFSRRAMFYAGLPRRVRKMITAVFGPGLSTIPQNRANARREVRQTERLPGTIPQNRANARREVRQTERLLGTHPQVRAEMRSPNMDPGVYLNALNILRLSGELTLVRATSLGAVPNTVLFERPVKSPSEDRPGEKVTQIRKMITATLDYLEVLAEQHERQAAPLMEAVHHLKHFTNLIAADFPVMFFSPEHQGQQALPVFVGLDSKCLFILEKWVEKLNPESDLDKALFGWELVKAWRIQTKGFIPLPRKAAEIIRQIQGVEKEWERESAKDFRAVKKIIFEGVSPAKVASSWRQWDVDDQILRYEYQQSLPDAAEVDRRLAALGPDADRLELSALAQDCYRLALSLSFPIRAPGMMDARKQNYYRMGYELQRRILQADSKGYLPVTNLRRVLFALLQVVFIPEFQGLFLEEYRRLLTGDIFMPGTDVTEDARRQVEDFRKLHLPHLLVEDMARIYRHLGALASLAPEETASAPAKALERLRQEVWDSSVSFLLRGILDETAQLQEDTPEAIDQHMKGIDILVYRRMMPLLLLGIRDGVYPSPSEDFDDIPFDSVVRARLFRILPRVLEHEQLRPFADEIILLAGEMTNVAAESLDGRQPEVLQIAAMEAAASSIQLRESAILGGLDILRLGRSYYDKQLWQEALRAQIAPIAERFFALALRGSRAVAAAAVAALDRLPLHMASRMSDTDFLPELLDEHPDIEIQCLIAEAIGRQRLDLESGPQALKSLKFARYRLSKKLKEKGALTEPEAQLNQIVEKVIADLDARMARIRRWTAQQRRRRGGEEERHEMRDTQPPLFPSTKPNSSSDNPGETTLSERTQFNRMNLSSDVLPESISSDFRRVSSESRFPQLLHTLQTMSPKLVLEDFREMLDPDDPDQFNAEQMAEAVKLAAATNGKMQVVIYNTDVSGSSYKKLQDLITQLEQDYPELKRKIRLSRDSLEMVAGRDIAQWSGPIVHLRKNRPDFPAELKRLGLEDRVLDFRYADENGAMIHTAGTLGVAAASAEALGKRTADLLKQSIPDAGVHYDPQHDHFYADREHAGDWGKLYEAMFVVEFARAA